MKYKVSFFLWVTGIILMLSGTGTMLLGDKTSVPGILFLVGVIFVITCMVPVLAGKEEE